jgi:CheY-like chemotaxis protein
MPATHPITLLVEDSDDDALLFRKAWLKAGGGAGLEWVDDGRQAVARLQAQGSSGAQGSCARLVLLDLKLPLLNGLDVLAWARGQAHLDPVCFVVLSSSGEARDVGQAFASGANGYFTKPVAVESLRELLHVVADVWPSLASPRAVLPLSGAAVWPAAALVSA